MPFKTPKFWYAPMGLKAYALTPLAWLYQIGHRLNQAFKPAPYKANIPVICIGNAVAGGSGKTPTAIAVMALIKENNVVQNPVFVTRGYGGTNQDAYEVDVQNYDVTASGDEAYLLAQHATTIIAKNRADGAKLAESLGADLIIMDDGLLNNSLHKDITFLVIDRAVDFGNSKTIPAGPLREPLSRILPKSDAVICIGAALHSDKPVFEATIISEAKTIDTTQKYIAFAGLGRPEKFKHTLEDLGADILGWHEFADHHAYSADEINDLQKEANTKNATLITTEKDHIRLPTSLKSQVQTLAITLEIKGKKSLTDFLNGQLSR